MTLDPSLNDIEQRFAAIRRVFGTKQAQHIRQMHLCVIGLGGVGSWAVEALARTGIGALTLIDFDIVTPGNINRQLHALTATLGQKKISVMRDRIHAIHPECTIHTVDDFVTTRTLGDYLAPHHGFDCVIDAIDSIKFKTEIIVHCRRNKIPIITTGGAGGITDPTQIRVADLSRTHKDPLASRVRARLRKHYGYTSNPKRTFGVECVFSAQQRVYPTAEGEVCGEKPGIHGVSLDCRFGYGSVSFVTAVFGFTAASRAIEKVFARQRRLELLN